VTCRTVSRSLSRWGCCPTSRTHGEPTGRQGRAWSGGRR